MNKVTFYGSSDDNFCVEGDVRDEWSAYATRRRVKLMLKGTVLPVIIAGEYSPKDYSGKWKIELESDLPPSFTQEFEPAKNDDDDYTDRLTIAGPFDDAKAVLDRVELIDALRDFDWSDLADDKMQNVASVLGI